MTAQSEITRFVQFYNSELTRTGFVPDHTSTRDTRIAFLQQTAQRFCSPLLAMKRADPGRPISDEVVVFVGAGVDYRLFADFLISGGSAAWKLSDHIEGYLPAEQPLVNPMTLGLLPEHTPVPTVPGCLGPTPIPPPTPSLPPYPGDPVFDEIGVALFADYALALQAPNPQMGRWFGRTVYDYLAGMPMADSIHKHRNEWREVLGLPPLQEKR
jgi:hypothetical protein